MELIPYSRIIRYILIGLVALLLFYPQAVPLNIGEHYGSYLMVVIFVFIMLTFINLIREDKINEYYLIKARKKYKLTQYVSHLKKLEEYLIKKINEKVGHENKIKDLKSRLQLVRKELSKFSQN